MVAALINILVLGVAIFLVAQILPGIKMKSFMTGIQVAIVYSIIHFLCFKILAFLALPLVIVTLGLFVFVINAILLWVTDQILDDFEIKNFGTTLLASLLISLCNSLIHWIL